MRLLITGAWQNARDFFPELEKRHEILFLQQERDPLPCDPSWVEGVVCNGLFLYHPIESFPNLRYIQLTSAGFDRVPMSYVQAQGIEVHNARGVYSVPMAEFAVAGVLQLYKQSRFFFENQKRHKWEKHRGLLELCGKTVLILGCGNVGTECARRFAAFGCRVLGVNRTVRENPAFASIAPLSALDEHLPEADVVILTLGLDNSTFHILDAARLGRMKPGAVLVNLARGALVDTAALEAALPRLGGAVLDVFEEEPLPASSPLWDAENVILTPHNSFVGDGNGERLWQVILPNLKYYL
ncbi:MAG: hydroxyacid dehydrogenase [Oscillospiraceae bacterium]|nr:hydroxyacid dehydrogenase [Oscillospiraceae bacterium]